MDKAKLTAPEIPPIAEGAQLLASMAAAPRQSDAKTDDCHMAGLAGRPLPLISFLACRRRAAERQLDGPAIATDIILSARRPDLAEAPRQPSVRRGPPAIRNNPAQPARVSRTSAISAFEPSAQDRNEAIELTRPPGNMNANRQRAAVALAGAGALIFAVVALLAIVG